MLLSCLVMELYAVQPVAAQEFYPDFALVVRLPSYEAYLTNLGDAPLRVDGYAVTSASGSLSPPDWAPLSLAGPEILAALGPGADGFVVANPSQTSLAELNPLSSATWQPGESWSIGFPFKSGDPDFVLDAVFQFTSPDGLALTGGTVVPPGELAPAGFLIVPEPPSAAVCLWGAATAGRRFRRRRHFPAELTADRPLNGPSFLSPAPLVNPPRSCTSAWACDGGF